MNFLNDLYEVVGTLGFQNDKKLVTFKYNDHNYQKQNEAAEYKF